jgi:hypothetical protein
MSSSKDETKELSALIEETGDKLTEDYHIRFCKLLDELGLFEEGDGGPVPLEVWRGVARAIADASGYRVLLQAAIVQPNGDDPNVERIIGHREIGICEPMVFIKLALE